MTAIITCKTCPWAITIKSKPRDIWCRNMKVNTGGQNFGVDAPACPKHPDMAVPDITDERTNLDHIREEDRK